MPMIPLLPLRYATRNLMRDKIRLLQTVGGSAMVVLLLVAAAAINAGLNNLLFASGSPLNVILLRAGSAESVQRSEISAGAAEIAVTAIPGIDTVLGHPAASAEIHHMTGIMTEGHRMSHALIRGVTVQAMLAHPEVRLLDGHFPGPGEILAGRLATRALGIPPAGFRTGATVRIENVDFTVAGSFAAPGTVMESEIWMPLGDTRTLARRDSLSCVVLRMRSPDGFDDAELFTKQRMDLELVAVRESDYFANLQVFYQPVRTMTWITALLVAAGAVFGGMNTLYAAFAGRVRECGTLQAVGFSRRALLLGFIQESCLACALGTLAGLLAAVVLLDGFSVSFALGSFNLRVTPDIAGFGLGAGLMLGLLGAVPAAVRCLRPSLPSALRG